MENNNKKLHNLGICISELSFAGNEAETANSEFGNKFMLIIINEKTRFHNNPSRSSDCSLARGLTAE